MKNPPKSGIFPNLEFIFFVIPDFKIYPPPSFFLELKIFSQFQIPHGEDTPESGIGILLKQNTHLEHFQQTWEVKIQYTWMI